MTLRFRLFIVVMTAASLACAVQIPSDTPVMTFTPSPVPASPTATRAAATARATAEADGQTAIVRQVSVNVRTKPGGDPTGEYVFAGQEVTVLEAATDENGDEWVRIAEPPGWVFAGCLEGSQKGCSAK